ncbi:unnamed protein product [Toxocara canis]|uniref:Peptidase A2 domain-containing protein n=1 Tax=Toxocara canis TaxID=6265 RepID=A0A183U641_TOXCA|nr:unnamed protein product [Toxocara canis]
MSPPSLLQPEVNALSTKKNCTQNPPSPCLRCGSHWARDCYFIDKTCHNCKLVGHKNGYCKNFTNKKKRNRKKSRATSNVVVIASTATDVAPVSRIYRKVKINGATIQMRLDTGTDVTKTGSKSIARSCFHHSSSSSHPTTRMSKFADISSPTSTLMGTKEEETATSRIPSRYLALTG